MAEARLIRVRGIVQGVGFRPFVYRLAREHSISGRVRNTAAGVIIEAEGEHSSLGAFQRALASDPPPLAVITEITVEPAQGNRYSDFSIELSDGGEAVDTLISPDVAVCEDCLREMLDPSDRRHRYPFINCTNCGPRYSIIRELPYDRPKTSMAVFPMCPDCRREYDDPADRRFHAQPNACPICGPRLQLVDRYGGKVNGDPLEETITALKSGKIVAVKGLGGFHLACDAANEEAVLSLRERKGRVGKPFAVMAYDVEKARRFVEIGDESRALLTSPRRPIVLLPKKPDASLAAAVAPGQSTFGVMLPYTPLHYLLLEQFEQALVMTSGNFSEEPIAIDNDEALGRLSALADLFLMHDRDIVLRADDSIARVVLGDTRMLRRSRGYAPQPVFLPGSLTQVLAVGPELKNTICYIRGDRAYPGQHIGDLQNLEALGFFREVIEHLKSVFELEPEAVAHDLHPDYLSTRWAVEESGLPAIGVQHHRAHIAACMADCGSIEPVIGIALDGTGYGDDGAIWGGEIFAGGPTDLTRVAHIAYVPLPGGDAAAREPWRCAFAHLSAAFSRIPDLPFLADVEAERRETVERMLETGTNTFSTSSAGRLFDAAAAIAGIRNRISYEAQAAMEFEAAADPDDISCYPFEIDMTAEPWLMRPEPLIIAMARDVTNGIPPAVIGARFHNTLALMIKETVSNLRKRTGIRKAALSGGVFQNRMLFVKLANLLAADGFEVLAHKQVPANDGGVSLGQALIAALKV